MSEAAKDTQAPRMMDAPTPAECAEDTQFFADHPQRPFRVGERGVTRWCRGGVYLRAPLPPSYSYVNTEAAAERAWWICAWPDLDPLERQALAKAARRTKGVKTT